LPGEPRPCEACDGKASRGLEAEPASLINPGEDARRQSPASRAIAARYRDEPGEPRPSSVGHRHVGTSTVTLREHVSPAKACRGFVRLGTGTVGQRARSGTCDRARDGSPSHTGRAPRGPKSAPRGGTLARPRCDSRVWRALESVGPAATHEVAPRPQKK